MTTTTSKNPAGATHFFRGTVFVDAGVALALAGSWAHFLSEMLTVIATLLAIVWYGVQVSESQRWQQFTGWLRRKRGK